MVNGINYFARGKITTEDYIRFVRDTVIGQDLLNGSFTYWPHLKRLYVNLTKTSNFSLMQYK